MSLKELEKEAGGSRALAWRIGGEGRRGVLYLPGFSDTYFHDHVAQRVMEEGWQFWVCEPRRCGRARLPRDIPHHMVDVREHHEDIGWALDLMGKNGASSVVILGHSTGGLTGLHYAMAHPSRVAGLVLNSPFLDFNSHGLERLVLLPLAAWAGGFMPQFLNPSRLPSHYGESLHKSMKGEWDFDLSVKPVPAFAPTLGFIRAVKKAQADVQRGRFEGRILLLHSSCSYHGAAWSEKVFTCDAILDVESMKRIGPSLGGQVEMAEIEGAGHDVFLSRLPARERALHRMVEFLRGFPAG